MACARSLMPASAPRRAGQPPNSEFITSEVGSQA